MTDTTPATEAGRLAVNEEGVRPSLILAIEAEARAKHSQHDYNAGRADALREKAEQVRALQELSVGDCYDGVEIAVDRADVLAVLTEQDK